MARVLICEDDDLIRALMHHVACRGGHEVLEAVNGLEALDYLDAGQRPDLIVLDLVMPELDGTEVLSRLRSGCYGDCCPVLIVSGFLSRADFDPRPPVVGVLPKPMSRDALATAIEFALTGRKFDPLTPQGESEADRE